MQVTRNDKLPIELGKESRLATASDSNDAADSEFRLKDLNLRVNIVFLNST